MRGGWSPERRYFGFRRFTGQLHDKRFWESRMKLSDAFFVRSDLTLRSDQFSLSFSPFFVFFRCLFDVIVYRRIEFLSYLRELRNDAVIIKNGLIGRREWLLSLSCFCRPSNEDVLLSRYNLVGRIWKVPVVSRQVKIRKCSLISQHYVISNKT